MCFLERRQSVSCKIQILVDLLIPINWFPECNMDIRAGTRGAIGMVITVEIKYHQSKSNNRTSDPQPSLLSSCIFSILCFSLTWDLFSFIFLHLPPPSFFITWLASLLQLKFIPNYLLTTVFFFSLSPFCVPRPHIAFANTNKHIRQMTLINEHLEWKTLNGAAQHIPTASLSSKKLLS